MTVNTMPTNLLKTRYLVDVPESAWALARQRRGDWQDTYDVAVWLKFSRRPDKPVCLLLTYRDSTGPRSVIVDEAPLPEGGKVLMLSGRVTIEGRNGLESMELQCVGLDNDIQSKVEDLHVQALVPEAPREKDRLIRV